MKRIAWSIAGYDSSNSAGLSTDLQVFTQFGVHGCGIVTALTAQNPHAVHAIECMPAHIIAAQLTALSTSMSARVIKISMIGNVTSLQIVQQFLVSYAGHVVWDPVLLSSSGTLLFTDDLHTYRDSLFKLLPLVTVFTPNKLEAEILLNRTISTALDIEQAARDFLALGAKLVCIKGGHFNNQKMSQDFCATQEESFWLSTPRHADKNYRGTGCTFAATIAAALAQDYRLADALVIAKMYVTRGIRLAQAYNDTTMLLHHDTLPQEGCDLPYLTKQPILHPPTAFNNCNINGLYAVVDSAEWVERLCRAGVKTLQLRIKNQNQTFLQHHIVQSIRIAARYNTRLYINDYWELALRYGAYGVHLGQEDLLTADNEQLRANGIRLGISTHCYAEVARAHALAPSYLACGPIFATTSKRMVFAPQGIAQLQYWRNLLPQYPWVAIGGINASNITTVLTTGVKSVALISAITKAPSPEVAVHQLLQLTGEQTCSLAQMN